MTVHRWRCIAFPLLALLGAFGCSGSEVGVSSTQLAIEVMPDGPEPDTKPVETIDAAVWIVPYTPNARTVDLTILVDVVDENGKEKSFKVVLPKDLRRPAKIDGVTIVTSKDLSMSKVSLKAKFADDAAAKGYAIDKPVLVKSLRGHLGPMWYIPIEEKKEPKEPDPPPGGGGGAGGGGGGVGSLCAFVEDYPCVPVGDDGCDTNCGTVVDCTPTSIPSSPWDCSQPP